MAEQEVKCPICNEPLTAGDDACPRCGFRLIGSTQAFTPVVTEEPSVADAKLDARPAFEVISGQYAGECFEMGQGRYTIGRDPKCDIFLSNMTVSRHHATIQIEGGAATIEDAGSLNGTWVDGEIVDSAKLVAGSHVQIGTFDMVFKFLQD
jgi:pSer/pThr/pTyr-binding forkhead associated (FHA) protein